MRYRYLGGEFEPETIVYMGQVEFTVGEIVNVTDKRMLSKLKGNRLFEAVKGRPKKDGNKS